MSDLDVGVFLDGGRVERVQAELTTLVMSTVRNTTGRYSAAQLL